MKFFKRKQKIETFEYFIPKEHIKKVYELSDIYHGLPIKQDCLAKYELWEYLFDLFPQIGGYHTCGLVCLPIESPKLVVLKKL